MRITTGRQYIDAIDAAIYVDADGTYTYHDARGYRTFKTLRGLNAHVRKQARMMGRDAPKITQ